MKTTGKCEYKMADGRVCGAPTNQVFRTVLVGIGSAGAHEARWRAGDWKAVQGFAQAKSIIASVYYSD